MAVIGEELDRGTKIRVIGDYDVDGICSAYILTRALREMGALADTAIPHRIRDGYGLNEALINEAHQDGVELIVTCDNGIAAQSQIALAREQGIRVVVTDHHEVPFTEEKGRRVQQLPRPGSDRPLAGGLQLSLAGNLRGGGGLQAGTGSGRA